MKVIVFYLPQYHPIPENDKWWGNGFTDWTNVAKARPRFHGHYQPHMPADLGFYDLRIEETRIAQAEMAKQYGIYGFCYYHYWFNGKMLLERPFNEVLKTGKPDFPFCLCWANENWTRRWDGQDNEILMKQDYSSYDTSEHMSWLSSAFKDHRYIRINNKPIFLIYNAIQIPNIEKVIKMWRYEAKSKHGIELYLCSVKSTGTSSMSGESAIKAGFDAVVDFQPNPSLAIKDVWLNLLKNFPQKLFNKIESKLNIPGQALINDTNIFNYETILNKWIERSPVGYKEFPCVAPSWDNSARGKVCTIVQNDRPELYGKWLEAACNRVINNIDDERIVFVNAWNEWGEGCHLEPDIKFGRKFLEITYETLSRYRA
ncbi:MAG: glycoside hydrolase family 99-like domain-containing protein [Sedimentisphaerales bacterium]|jgi:lipopolysaccharide biosynthesis protein